MPTTALADATQGEGSDRSAEVLIKEAIEEHYLFTEFDVAERMLLDALATCQEHCRKETRARIWMYLGIVRASGLDQSDQALRAFDWALAENPSITLDLDLAGAAVQRLWTTARERKRSSHAQPKHTTREPEPGLRRGALRCTPRVLEAPPRQRLPIDCRRPAQAQRLLVRYLEFGESKWHEMELLSVEPSGSQGRDAQRMHALLPCSATAYSGPLRFYIVALGPDARVVESLGSMRSPLVLDVRDDASVTHALPNGNKPPSCKQQASCPPGFPCAALGESCEVEGDCKEGLSCQHPGPGERGTCQRPKTPVTDGPPVHWFGLHAGLDLVPLPSGRRLCSAESQSNPDSDYDCYLDSQPYPDSIGAPAANGEAGAIDGGFTAGTLRLLASYSWRATPWLALGARAGWAVLGAPDEFMPVHLEIETNYLFVEDPRAFLQPFASLSGGLAEVGAGMAVEVDDENYASGAVSKQPVRAFTSAGPWFAALGLGSRLAFGEHVAIQLDAQVSWLLPEKRFAVRPSLGVTAGLAGD